MGQRQDFAARSISSLAGPDGDPVAKDVRAVATPPSLKPCLAALGLLGHYLKSVYLCCLT